MLLNRTAHRIGYIGPMYKWTNKKIESINQFLDFIILHLNYNTNRKIQVFCVDVQDIDFSEINFTLIEEDSLEQEKIDIISNFITSNKLRLFFLIRKTYFLGSQIPEIVDQTKKIIEILSIFFSQIGSKDPSILVRIGSAYGNRKETLARFCKVVNSMPIEIKSRLIVINDEKPSLFSVTDLLSGVFYVTKTPICFRFLPHHFNDGGLTQKEALFLSSSTWPDGVKPIFIHSEAESFDEFGLPESPKISDDLKFRIPTFNLETDVILDLKFKDLACTKYMKENKSLKPIVINKLKK